MNYVTSSPLCYVSKYIVGCNAVFCLIRFFCCCCCCSVEWFPEGKVDTSRRGQNEGVISTSHTIAKVIIHMGTWRRRWTTTIIILIIIIIITLIRVGKSEMERKRQKETEEENVKWTTLKVKLAFYSQAHPMMVVVVDVSDKVRGMVLRIVL